MPSVRKLLGASILIVSVIVAATVVLVDGGESSAFSPERWQAEHGVPCDSDRAHERQAMVDDVLDKHVRPGLSSDSVRGLLGPPDEQERSHGFLWWTYFTGNDRLDCTTLVVRFKSDRVVDARAGQT
jgi:hypothetical protein